MIFIPRKLFKLYIFLSISILLAIGIAAYAVFSPQIEYSPLRQKIIAEWFLFGTIVGTCVLVLLAVRIATIRSRIKKELGRIRSMSTYVSLSSQLKSRRLHELGPLLSDLFMQVSRINERQSLKMSAQHSLLDFLSSNVQAPIAVTDLFGRILYISNEFGKKMHMEREDLIDGSIENLISNVYMQPIVSSIETRRTYRKEQNDDIDFNVFPIYNREREPTYLLFDLRDSSSFSQTLGTGTPGTAEGESRRAAGTFGKWKTLNRFIGRFMNGLHSRARD
ncbi:MAG: hypothetical protein ACP5IA_03765 [Sediminispirochaetaceae bacterium]